MPIWVSDTSPICYFARLGLLDVLRELLGRVRVPPAVVDEIDRGRVSISELPDLRTLEWVRIEAGRSADTPNIQLGPGETEALGLARSLSSEACDHNSDKYISYLKSFNTKYSKQVKLFQKLQRDTLAAHRTPF